MRLGDTPVLIPNTTVKTQTADGTALGTVWESRWMPESWGCSSVGRAPALQAGGREFESLHLHSEGKLPSSLVIQRAAPPSGANMYLENCIYEKDPKNVKRLEIGKDIRGVIFRRR